ncbi:MAG: alpha/beta hydrolase [Acidimicrobiia bacterium]|nr:alpha/beta hydrolase [Acidimicrobiia bacterium]
MTYAFDPELAPLVELLPAGDLTDVDAARAGIAALIAPLNDGVDTAGIDVSDDAVIGTDAPPVTIRVYAPSGPAPDGGRPALLDIHGGGFVVGSIDMEHAFATQVARELDAVVVVPEYRLAPEHPFPAGLDDCYATLTWIHERAAALGIDPARIGVGGQSAGGGLAAATALLARDRGGPALCFQFLGIPELDHRLTTTSMQTFVDTPLWHRANAVLSWQYYLGMGATEVSPYASPAIATDLAGLPPAYVSTMEFDPLRDEGIVYALRMMEAGVSVELHSYPGTFHGSAMIPTAEVSRRGHAEVVDALRRGLGAPST